MLSLKNRKLFTNFSRYQNNHLQHEFPEVKFDANGQRIFTRKEVSVHNTATDAWLIIDKGVYNVTHWIPYHPGGERKIMNWVGKDASAAFEEQGHSGKARDVLEEYRIGVTLEERRYMCVNSVRFDIQKEMGLGPSKLDWKEGWEPGKDFVT